jgi:16S rRNA processing protein RimM
VSSRERLIVGRVAKAHGIRGEVVVEPLTDHPERFAVGATLEGPGGPLTVVAARPHQARLLVRFDAIPDRNAAELLRGAELTIDAADAAPLPEGRYYAHELDGLEVRSLDGTVLGVFAKVVSSPAHDLWVVLATDGREVLVPAVAPIIVEVALADGVITLDPPEGLF